MAKKIYTYTIDTDVEGKFDSKVEKEKKKKQTFETPRKFSKSAVVERLQLLYNRKGESVFNN